MDTHIFVDYTVASISPAEQDLDGSSTVSVTLTLNTQSEVLSIEKMYDLTGQFECFFSGKFISMHCDSVMFSLSAKLTTNPL